MYGFILIYWFIYVLLLLLALLLLDIIMNTQPPCPLLTRALPLSTLSAASLAVSAATTLRSACAKISRTVVVTGKQSVSTRIRLGEKWNGAKRVSNQWNQSSAQNTIFSINTKLKQSTPGRSPLARARSVQQRSLNTNLAIGVELLCGWGLRIFVSVDGQIIDLIHE